jgi:hypothetical protein
MTKLLPLNSVMLDLKEALDILRKLCTCDCLEDWPACERCRATYRIERALRTVEHINAESK